VPVSAQEYADAYREATGRAVTVRTVRRWVNEGKVPSLEYGGHAIVIPDSAVEALRPKKRRGLFGWRRG